MNLPLYMKDIFGYEASLVVMTLVGFFFGFVLERSGFGRAQNIVGQFYFDNMRVLKVMFTAIATAAVGMALLGGLGVLDMAAVSTPPSFLLPAAVGGLLVGAGMVVSGYCPGTSVVAAASGNLDGVFAYAGILVGSLLFGLAFPLVEGFYLSTPLDGVRFPELLNIPHAILGAGVVVMAVGAFLGGEWVERFMARRNNSSPPDVAPRTRNKVFAVMGALAVAALLTLPLETRSEAETPAKPFVRVAALDLAQMLLRDPTSLHMVDLREPAACKRKTIPGAICLPEGGSGPGFIADLPATRTLVLFSHKELAKLPAPVARFEGPVLALAGGFDSFSAAVLSKPTAPENPTVAALDHYRLRHALFGHFTGVRAQAQAITVKPMKIQRKLKKGGGC